MSYAEIEKYRLKRACEKAIAYIEKYRIREKRLFVRDLLRKQKKCSERSFIGWFYPWPVSKKDILKNLSMMDSITYDLYTCCVYGKSLECAKKLLCLAINTNEHVFVSSDDIGYIKRWL